MKEKYEEIIEKENYTVDSVVIESEDGYLLTLHRIPNEDGPPVFLKHGFLSSTVDWLKSGKNRSLPYFLWDRGFDVWMGNARGNAYSRRHKTLSTDDHRFWDFNLHEMGYYDDAAFIEYISKTRNSKLFYVGYSLGALTFSIMAAERPEVAKNVKAMVALAPAIYMGNINHGLINLIAMYQKELQALAQLFKMRELFGHSWVLDYIGNYVCRLHLIGDFVCSQIFYYILGYSPKQLDKTRLPIIFTKYPSGMSFQSLYHFLQLISSNDLQKYDYGLAKNMDIYNSSTPPKYNISRINIPTAVFLSKTDPLSTEQDALRFYNELPV
ncbi:lipase 1-like [Trichogramma pretiosum]|uniref:lipase 1-like n=1 Tax=Trichogramma pretiosum TaxID=7493 RepID=UPI000C71B4F1|nr:lipase 1-like [Trichogramma pretiosum]